MDVALFLLFKFLTDGIQEIFEQQISCASITEVKPQALFVFNYVLYSLNISRGKLFAQFAVISENFSLDLHNLYSLICIHFGSN